MQETRRVNPDPFPFGNCVSSPIPLQRNILKQLEYKVERRHCGAVFLPFLCAFLYPTSTLAVCRDGSTGTGLIFPPTLSPSGALELRLCFGYLLVSHLIRRLRRHLPLEGKAFYERLQTHSSSRKIIAFYEKKKHQCLPLKGKVLTTLTDEV